MTELIIGGIAIVGIVAVVFRDEYRTRPKATVIGSQAWWRRYQDEWTPPQHCDAAWNPWRDDVGPRGRVDVTPGGRIDP